MTYRYKLNFEIGGYKFFFKLSKVIKLIVDVACSCQNKADSNSTFNLAAAKQHLL